MTTITKKALVKKIANKKGIHPSQVKEVMECLLESVRETLVEGNRLEFRDFGIFELVERKEKVGRNPKRPKEEVLIPKRTTVKFTPGKKMKERVELRRVVS